jgi:phosphatidylinositol phospholipase C gamma-1
VIAARHLVKPGKGVASPFVEFEVIGLDGDRAKYKTRMIPDNGFNPVWNETLSFDVSLPELACLGITVFDQDMFDDFNAIGQAVLPLGSRSVPGLRPGFRSIQLLNTYGCVN